MSINGSNFTARYSINDGDLKAFNDYNGVVYGIYEGDTVYVALYGANGATADARYVNVNGAGSNYKTLEENGETYVFVECHLKGSAGTIDIQVDFQIKSTGDSGWYAKYIPNWGAESTKTEQSAKIAAIDSVMGAGASNMLSETVYVGSDESYNWLVAIYETEGQYYVIEIVFEGTSDNMIGSTQANPNGDPDYVPCDGYDQAQLETVHNKLFAAV